MNDSVVVCGAGTMGYGIALTCAQFGMQVKLFDISESALNTAASEIKNQLHSLVSKGKISIENSSEINARIEYTGNLKACKGEIVIEAVAEIRNVKVNLLKEIASLNSPSTIYTSNTSSLSIDDIAEGTGLNERFLGLHFFNPAPVMKLVEVVKGKHTSPEVIAEIIAFSKRVGKTPVVCNDSPGFIVNRVARHFYLEALKQVEEHSCSIESADALLESCGFKMGPFKLMDLIGNDVNLAVTQSLYESCGRPLRFRPSALQKEKVESGELGRKTKKGYYLY